MAYAWTLPMKVFNALWQRAFPRVLAQEWKNQLHDNPSIIGNGSAMNRGKQFLKYISDQDRPFLDTLKQDNASAEAKGAALRGLLLGEFEIPSNMELRIDDRLDHQFLYYFYTRKGEAGPDKPHGGLVLPWPKDLRLDEKAADEEEALKLVFKKYMQEYAGLRSINIPGLKTIEVTSPFIANGESAGMSHLTGVVNELNALEAIAADPPDSTSAKQDAMVLVRKDLEVEPYTLFTVEGVHLYQLMLWFPKSVAQAWEKKDRATYETMQENMGARQFVEEYDSQEQRLALSIDKIYHFGEEMALTDKGILVPSLPDYPKNFEALYDSWIAGQSHNPTYSDTPTSNPA